MRDILKKDKMETLRVILRTKKTKKSIEKNKKLELSESEINNLFKYYNMIDGLEIKVITFMGKARMIDYQDKDSVTIREAIYLLEQNTTLGMYMNDYKNFMKKWNSGKYYNENIEMIFEASEIEVIENINY
ncbi:hypothetical protein [Clostridioides difficile]|uniref:hypothetical protein n=1 Tax=Clostridioides difficile TaxID=1496 RepID=UPI001033E250|nr:hypothetical protein [Clostridioides difficile]MDM9944116.1 hypothetical protein [Clostridioides difficile]